MMWRARARALSTGASAAPLLDVLIVGGGVVGGALAARLAALPALAGLSVGVVEARAPAAAPARGAPPDARTYALSPASVALLEAGGAWAGAAASGRARNYDEMRVWEARGPARLAWGAPRGPALGTMVEHAVVAASVWARLEELAASGRIDLRAGARAGGAPLRLAALALPPARADARAGAAARAGLAGGGGGGGGGGDDDSARATLSDGTVLRARLVVGADGAASATRAAAGGGTRGWDYADQRAVVGTVRLEGGGGGGGGGGGKGGGGGGEGGGGGGGEGDGGGSEGGGGDGGGGGADEC